MKFKIGQEVYYVDKYIFTIEKIKIDFTHNEYYCDETYAMFEEKDLFETLKEAKSYANSLLRNFYNKKWDEINSYEN